MPSRAWAIQQLGIGDQLSEDGVGEPSFESASGFHAGLPAGKLSAPELSRDRTRSRSDCPKEQQTELVERYEAGTFNKALARIYGIYVETVRADHQATLASPLMAIRQANLRMVGPASRPVELATPRRAEGPTQ